MTKYILHGGFERADNDLNRSFYAELVKDVPEGGTVLLVYFTAPDDEVERTYQEKIDDFKRKLNRSDIDVILATKEGFLREIKDADAVHFRGGDTRKLLTALRNYPDLRPLFSGKTISGSSAGAYALARYGSAHSEDEVREGLGLVPIRVICHYESPELPPSPASVESLMHTAEDLELVMLKDYEWKVFNQD